ncbi:hypothetical protein JBL43_11820 [Aureibaculum sp. A20]|uniref:Carboxypeptidase regulatory-like domain-containing protein n=1 Tax=Aureibaculum flavum TaxID=2795986 RepID=A0ABS0WSG1_9FLAO|nr:hypothetical protein [Aureibaculum flavum]MBJ2174929.1 hypothetical protein [Aureibaculum flavum]
MRKIFYLLLIISSCVENVISQSIHLQPGDEKILKQIPEENVFVRANSHLLFAGEYMYYSFYALKANSLQPSNISTIGYVELINDSKEVIFKHKLRIENGKAQGDYFIPVNIPSGSYKIIGYTNWMLNANSYFSQDLSIINPYLADQQAILTGSKNLYLKEERKTFNNTNLDISLDNNQYSKRSKVNFKIKNDQRIKGNFTLSAREVSPIKSNQNNTPKLVKSSIKNTTFKNDQIILPELRGEIISGKIIPKNGNTTVDNLQVSLSIPNEGNYIIKLASVSANGDFYFNIIEKYKTKDAVFEILGEHKENYNIFLDPKPTADYSNISFKPFFIDSVNKKQIIDRSIHNQIENGYFNVKPDSILSNQIELPFNYNNLVLYNLDEYTRFQTIKETLVEVTENVWAEKRDDKYVFQVRILKAKNNNYNYKVNKPLVLIDGVFVSDHDALMYYDARKVKSIGIIRERYVFGRNVFTGVVIIETIKGDYQINSTSILKKELFTPVNNKNYYKQKYNFETKTQSDRIPDFRYQLLWKPNFEINKEDSLGTFYTSDVTGTFEISITGFTDEGEQIFINKTFTVK